MTPIKHLTAVIGRIAAILVPAPAEPLRAPTEDDLASERFFNRQRRIAAGQRGTATR
jgi:hypothetical protein